MGKFSDYIAFQCGNPRGAIGKIMTWTMNRVNGFMYKGIVRSLNLSENSKILDIGFGNGYLERRIYRKVKCSVYGIDISEDMLKSAINNENMGKPNLFVRIIKKVGAGFKCQFTYQTYQQFFEKAGYTDIKYSIVKGKTPCAIAVITKK